MKTVLAETIGESARLQISTIMVDGFYGMGLSFLSKDKEKLAKAFAHMFRLDMYYLAVDDDGTIMGIAGLTDGHTPSVKMDKTELCQHLGSIKGRIAYPLLRRMFEESDPPFTFTSDMANVEFVSVGTSYRGHGVAYELIRDMIALTSYQQYVLDVSDTNIPAVKTYQKLGFEEFLRVKMNPILARLGGMNALLYMKYKKS